MGKRNSNINNFFKYEVNLIKLKIACETYLSEYTTLDNTVSDALDKTDKATKDFIDFYKEIKDTQKKLKLVMM